VDNNSTPRIAARNIFNCSINMVIVNFLILCLGTGELYAFPSVEHFALLSLTSRDENEVGNAKISFDLGLEQEEFLSPKQAEFQQSSVSNYNFNIYIKDRRRIESFGFEFLAQQQQFSGKNINQMAIPEAFYSLKSKSSVVSLGRKKIQWNRMDKDWNLGLWQPLVRWDYLRPKTQGLTGIFYQYRSTLIRFTLFGSAIHLPEQGPKFWLEDGQFVSRSRWFKSPQAVIDFMGAPTEFVYSLNRPSDSEVIFQNSLAAKIEMGLNKGAFLELAFADKPRNQFHLSADHDGLVRLGELDTVAHVNVYPVSIRHLIYGVESGYQWKYLKIYVSLSQDSPRASEVDRDWIEAPLLKSRYYAMGSNFKLKPSYFGLLNVKLNYLRHNEIDNLSESKGHINAYVKTFLSTIPFEESVSLQLDFLLYQKSNNKLLLNFGYVASLLENGNWYFSEISYSFTDLLFYCR